MLEDIPITLECPFCEDAYVHPIAVKVNAGGSITNITSKGTETYKGTPAPYGTLIQITYQCESGHRWIENQQFHKGNIFISYDLLEDKSSDMENTGSLEINLADELWRD